MKITVKEGFRSMREGARGARYQKEADLLLCVGPSREVFPK